MKVSTVFYLFSHLLNPYVSALPLLLLHSLYLSSTVRLAQTPLFFIMNFLLFLKILFPLHLNSSSLVISTFTLMIPTLPVALPSFPYLIPSIFLNLSLSPPTQLAILLIFSSLALSPLFFLISTMPVRLSLTIMPYYLSFLFLPTLDFLELPNLSAILNQLISLLFPMIFSLPVFTLLRLIPYPPTFFIYYLTSHGQTCSFKNCFLFLE